MTHRRNPTHTGNDDSIHSYFIQSENGHFNLQAGSSAAPARIDAGGTIRIWIRAGAALDPALRKSPGDARTSTFNFYNAIVEENANSSPCQSR
jgi:hypothetical protein